MSKSLSYEEYSQQFLTQLPKGAFLTVREGDRLNTMTIGWGTIGYIWQKPILMVMVRYSRHTYDLIDKAPDFSVSLPAPGEMKKNLTMAGSKSGRDVDKFEAAAVNPQAARHINSPVIKDCKLVFECKTVFKQIMDPELLDDSIRTKSYPDSDYHVMYYGEIVACYTP
ncbi:MAG: flavin reductase family protein [Syntrophomonadaceae bacterium]|jgi:flavin reductase (DIM6/NTAB) family NADH-FMN oxidoreductase RutF